MHARAHARHVLLQSFLDVGPRDARLPCRADAPGRPPRSGGGTGPPEAAAPGELRGAEARPAGPPFSDTRGARVLRTWRATRGIAHERESSRTARVVVQSV